MELEEDPDSKVLELKLKALILETLHYIDIVETLSDGKVRSTDHWLWQKQLRSLRAIRDFPRQAFFAILCASVLGDEFGLLPTRFRRRCGLG